MMVARNAQARLEGDLTNLRRQVETIEPLSTRVVQAEDEFARFFAQSLDLLCIAGLDGYFKRLNPEWTTVLGWSLEELKARPFLDFVHPDDRQATQVEVVKLAEGADSIAFENRYLCRDGSYQWLRWNARPVPGRRRIYATARDVTQQKRLEREILEIVDREKERLGRELHDGLCQTLAGIAALSSTLSRRLETDSESEAATAGAAQAAEITGLVNEAIAEARGLARGLAPPGLQDGGLDAALEALADNVRHLFHVSCSFEADRPFPRLESEVEAHLFRIAQEAVSNAVAHARADRIEIGWSLEGRTGVLSVRDDGVGLPEAASDRDGIGLHTMAYRARLIGARLEVWRRVRQGTAVTCAYPLPDPPESYAPKST